MFTRPWRMATTSGGVVTSAKGPEAGVWVIAETNDLPTQEGGKGTKPKLVKFQLRPDPLAK